jgi:hypothetical protein
METPACSRSCLEEFAGNRRRVETKITAAGGKRRGVGAVRCVKMDALANLRAEQERIVQELEAEKGDTQSIKGQRQR